MATEIRYSAAQKKKLKAFEWNGRGSTVGAMRAMKMLAPRCSTCQTPDVVAVESPTRYTWMKDCTHSPYIGNQPKVIKVQRLSEEPDEDGDYVLEETTVRTKMIPVPNIVEIPLSVRFDDGEAGSKALRHGFRLLPDEGFAPMCEMYGCGKAWPTVGTEFGAYCSPQHARLCVADEQEDFFLIINNPKLQTRQIRQIEI